MKDENNGRSKVHVTYSGTDYRSAFSIFDATNDFSLFSGQDDQSLDGGSDQGDSEVGGLCTEDHYQGPFNHFEEPNTQQPPSLYFTPELKAEEKKIEDNIEINDFPTEEEKIAAIYIAKAISLLIHNSCEDVAEWLFGIGDNSPTFEDCCVLHDARPEIIRLRIYFELWRIGHEVDLKWDFKFSTLPDFIYEKSFFLCGAIGCLIAKTVWINPGISKEELNKKLGIKTNKELDTLIDEYVISVSATGVEKLFVTGINPIMEEKDKPGILNVPSYRIATRRQSFHWAARFND